MFNVINKPFHRKFFLISRNDKSEWVPIGEETDDNEIDLTNLVPDKEYEFRIIASNQYGQSEPTEAVTVPSRAGTDKRTIK